MRSYPALSAEIDAERAITREEAEAWVRQIDRRCLGPMVLSSEDSQPWWDRMKDESQEYGDIADDLIRDQGLVERLIPYVGLRWFMDPETLKNRIGEYKGYEAMAFCLRCLCASIGCGEDMNTQILAGPLDGQPRDMTCPRCGRVHPLEPAKLNVEA